MSDIQYPIEDSLFGDLKAFADGPFSNAMFSADQPYLCVMPADRVRRWDEKQWVYPPAWGSLSEHRGMEEGVAAKK